MTNSTFLPCPEGHYCEEGTTEPQPCTGGRMSTTTGRVSNEDCPLCTPGYYCPNDTINVHGIPCRSTYECPEGKVFAMALCVHQDTILPPPMTKGHN